MTDERRKFLANISKEEHIIRFKIIEQKVQLKSEKFWLNHVECNKEQIQQTCWRIYRIKTIIKSLKKQLPQELVFYNEPNYWSWVCPACRYKILNLDGKLDPIRIYCPKCGQKLR